MNYVNGKYTAIIDGVEMYLAGCDEPCTMDCIRKDAQLATRGALQGLNGNGDGSGPGCWCYVAPGRLNLDGLTITDEGHTITL